MAEPLAITILRRKRDRIRETIAKYEARLKEAQADLAHVIAALRLFEIDNNVDDFPAYVDLNRVFRRGETTTFCLETLRAEGPLDTRELTARLMRRKGLDEHDKVLSQAIALRIVQTLRSRARRGLVDGTNRRKGACVWRIVEPLTCLGKSPTEVELDQTSTGPRGLSCHGA